MEPTAFLTRLAKTEKRYDQYRCPPFYIVPVAGSKRDEFLKRTKMTDDELREAIYRFKEEFPTSIHEEIFEKIQVYSISTYEFTTTVVKVKYSRRR